MKFGASVLNVEMYGTVGGMDCIAQIVVLNLNPNSIMKTENTPENKARFFALYLNQKNYTHDKYGTEGPVENDTLHINWLESGSRDDGYYLALRSISSLTDEEYKWFAHHSAYKLDDKNIVSVGKAMVNAIFEPNGWSGNTLQQMCDYIRTIGILIPWMDLSVEDIKTYGWAKELKA